jgi:hypothetical protein
MSATGLGKFVATLSLLEACGAGATTASPKTGNIIWAGNAEVPQFDPDGRTAAANPVEQWVYMMLFLKFQ